MPSELRISIGQHSDKGRKETNQDFHGALIPTEPVLGMKGIAIAVADGISSSDVSHVASKSAVKSFLTDYYCTPESLVGKDCGPARPCGNQLLATRANPAQPAFL